MTDSIAASEIPALKIDEFVRSVSVNSNASFQVLLGAGASITSGVPSAFDCTWHWKRDIFLTNNSELGAYFSELSLPSVRMRIQQWLDQQGRYPRENSPEEYSTFAEACYPRPADRQAFFQRLVTKAKPSLGYHYLCCLAEAGLISGVWTTNFDGLVAKTSHSYNTTAIEIGMDSAERVYRGARAGELLCVSLHGDYRYDRLKNTTQELQQQDRQLAEVLKRITASSSLIVSGYSGRDRSLMTLLGEAYSQAGSGVLYWCGIGTTPPNSVTELIKSANASRREAYYVATEGFDDTFSRVAHSVVGPLVRERVLSAGAVPANQENRPKAFAVSPTSNYRIAKTNVFSLSLPMECLSFSLVGPVESPWQFAETRLRDPGLVAVPFRDRFLCFSTLQEIANRLGNLLDGTPERVVLPKLDDDGMGSLSSLLISVFCLHFASALNLRTNGRGRVWMPDPMQQSIVGGVRLNVHKSISIHLKPRAQSCNLTLELDRYFDCEQPSASLVGSLKIEKNRLLSQQWNNVYSDELNEWIELLRQLDPSWEFPYGSGSGFRFSVTPAPSMVGIASSPRDSHSGIFRTPPTLWAKEVTEPFLSFGTSQSGARRRDVHPIRGMLEGKPYDHTLTGILGSVKISVVCPEGFEQSLQTFLDGLQACHDPAIQESDYLLPYPGFSSAYSTPITLPRPGTDSWETIRGAPRCPGTLVEAREIVGLQLRSMERIRARSTASTVIFFIPDEWRAIRLIKSETDYFHLHDVLKAHCVQRGMTSQLLDEDTLKSSQQCRIAWWLSLAIYCKSMRTPFVLEGLDSDTAFVGLGFGVERNPTKGSSMLLGCGHLYGSNGVGLQYRLARLESSTIRRRNPYMSREDAERVGERVNQLFYESRGKLPKRVVIHKQTPFCVAELQGLRAALREVESLELLEVNIDHSLRCLASKVGKEGRLAADGFPIRRGTIIHMSDRELALFAHGSADALRQGYRYFKGKRRIPAPLRIARHSGRTDTEQVATEILALTKMNWNSFDYYSQLPATIESSRSIASIACFLTDLGSESLDYRLFI